MRSIVLAVVSFLAATELFSRLQVAAGSEYLYQPFRQFQAHEMPGWPWHSYNQYGARGYLDLGGRPRIAVLGGSFAAGYALPQIDTWPEQLKRRFHGAQVNNFAMIGTRASFPQPLAVLRRARAAGERYDAILFSNNFYLLPPEAKSVSAELSRIYDPLAPDCKSLFPLRRLIATLVQSQPVRSIGSLLPDWTDPDLPDDQRYAKAVQAGAVFVDRSPGLSAQAEAEITDYVQSLRDAARGVTDQLIYVVPPIAEAEGESPDAATKWKKLVPADSPGTYLSRRALARRWNAISSLYAGAAERLGLPVIDLRPTARSLVRRGGDYFLDHVHPTSKGSTVIADVVGTELAKRLAPAP